MSSDDPICAWCGDAIINVDPYVRDDDRIEHEHCYGLRMREERDKAIAQREAFSALNRDLHARYEEQRAKADDYKDRWETLGRVAKKRIDKQKAEIERLRGVIDKCRESAGLQPSPDGPSGDVTNLLHRGDLAEAGVERLNRALDNMRAEYMGNLNEAEAKNVRLSKEIATLDKANEGMGERLTDVKLYAEKLLRDQSRTVQIYGADLKQLLDADWGTRKIILDPLADMTDLP